MKDVELLQLENQLRHEYANCIQTQLMYAAAKSRWGLGEIPVGDTVEIKLKGHLKRSNSSSFLLFTLFQLK